MNRDLLVKTLKLHVETAHSLKELSRHNINFQIWQEKTRETLERAFGPQGEMVKRFNSIKYHLPPKLHDDESHDLAEIRQAYLSGLDKAITILMDSIKVLSDGVDVQLHPNCFLHCDTNGELDLKLHLSFQDIVNYVDQTNLPKIEQKEIKEELQQIYDLLSKKKLDQDKVKLHKSKLVGILNSMVGKTGGIFLLYQLLEILETLIVM